MPDELPDLERDTDAPNEEIPQDFEDEYQDLDESPFARDLDPPEIPSNKNVTDEHGNLYYGNAFEEGENLEELPEEVIPFGYSNERSTY